MRKFAMTLGRAGILIAGLAASPAVYAQEPQPRSLTPAELDWTGGPPMLPPGASMAVIEGSFNRPGLFAVRLKFPANYKIPAHWHPAKVTVTVISGTFNLGLGDKLDTTKGKPLPAGSIFEMPATIHHFGWTSEETIIQQHGIGPWGINYLNPAENPRQK